MIRVRSSGKDFHKWMSVDSSEEEEEPRWLTHRTLSLLIGYSTLSVNSARKRASNVAPLFCSRTLNPNKLLLF